MITHKIGSTKNNQGVLQATGEGELSLNVASLSADNNVVASTIQLLNFTWQTQNTIALSLGTGEPIRLFVNGKYICNSRPDLYLSQPTSDNLNITMSGMGKCVVEYIINP